MFATPLEILQSVNRILRSELVRFLPEHNHCSQVRAQELSEMRRRLQLARESVKEIQTDPQVSSELADEIARYRGNLLELKKTLPRFQMRLLTERSRLETAQTQVTRAAAWAQTNKKTL